MPVLKTDVEQDLVRSSRVKRKILVQDADGVRRFYHVVLSIPPNLLSIEWILITFEPIKRFSLIESIPALFQSDPALGSDSRFYETLSRYLQDSKVTGQSLMVLAIDVVGLRAVNESEGYDIGDRVLALLQLRLGVITKSAGVVAHMADDDYIVVLRSDGDGEVMASQLEWIRSITNKPFLIKEMKKQLHLRVSIGVALASSTTDSFWRLIDRARMSCVEAKRDGNLNVVIYSDQAGQNLLQRFKVEQSIYNALNNNEMSVVFQPQFCLLSGALLGAEALIRWVDHEGVNHSPANFVPIATRCGLLLPLTDYVLTKVLDFQKRALAKGLCPVPIALNIAPIEFAHNGRINDLMARIFSARVIPSLIEFEITEDSLLGRDENTLRYLRQLHESGVAVAIDDFGVGYSSLDSLRIYPVDKLKIDRCFVSNLSNDSESERLVQLLVNIGLAFNMKVLAEGIETEEQAIKLREMGCHIAQGFWFARPESESDFMRRLIGVATEPTTPQSFGRIVGS